MYNNQGCYTAPSLSISTEAYKIIERKNEKKNPTKKR